MDGSRQVHGIDCTKCFAKVAKYTTLPLFFAVAAVHDIYVHQLRVHLFMLTTCIVYVHPHLKIHVLRGHRVKLLI